MDTRVVDNRDAHRFELHVDGETAYLDYQRSDGKLALIHTEVPVALRGRHLGDELVEAALMSGRAEGLTIVAVCPFVRAYLGRHPPTRA